MPRSMRAYSQFGDGRCLFSASGLVCKSKKVTQDQCLICRAPRYMDLLTQLFTKFAYVSSFSLLSFPESSGKAQKSRRWACLE